MEEETLFERLARERNITVEEVRAIISARIEAGMNDPDPEKRAQWERIPWKNAKGNSYSVKKVNCYRQG